MGSSLTISPQNFDSGLFVTWLMKILIEEQIGYDVLVHDQYVFMADNYRALARNELDIKSEEWPMEHSELYQQYVRDAHRVEDVGALGFTGRLVSCFSLALFLPIPV
jgi:ABC-type proline/glycine betaine transport system substrate-binding protein